MKISIITICYNEPNLEETCQSIVNQTWQDFEWVVVDGNSNQKTQEIWDKYKYRIDKFISEPDNGRYNAMNKGIMLVSGEYLNFLNAGDYYTDNNVLQKVVELGLDKDIVYGNLNFIEKTGKLKTWNFPEVVDNEYLCISSLPHPACFIKKELFNLYGLYNEKYKVVSDWEKFLEFILMHHSSYKHINLQCANFNLEGISSTDKDLCKKERSDVLKKYFTEEQINKFLESKDSYSFVEQIFSMKNSKNGIHKIITFLGCHLKIKRSHK